MRMKQEACGRSSAQMKVEVPGTQDEVWQAIATKPGISPRWVPEVCEKRNGKLALYVRAFLTVIALLIQLPSAQAQEPPELGKEHDYLKRLVGTWDAESDFGTGTMTYRMGLNGLWLIGEFEGEFGGLKFQSLSLDTYDSMTKKYRSVWADSFSTLPRIMEGTLDKYDKVMTLTGEGRGQDDLPAKYKSITEIKDADTVNFALSLVEKDGKEHSLVTITYKRKK